MKNLARLFLLVTLAGLLVVTYSCTKNDDSSTPPAIPLEQTSLVGTWNLDYYLENGSLVEEPLCNRQLKYKFLANNTYTLTTFAGEEINSCVEAIIINGTWEYLGDNQFSLLINGDTTADEVTITYQDNFTSFTIVRSSTLTEVYERQ